MAFDVAGNVNEEREARRVAFGEAICAEAPDLIKTALGKIGRITVAAHAFEKIMLEGVNRADLFKGRHREEHAWTGRRRGCLHARGIWARVDGRRLRLTARAGAIFRSPGHADRGGADDRVVVCGRTRAERA